MIKILFVCHGNICRSPMAEFVMKHIMKQHNLDASGISSAATSTEEIGSGVHRGTRQVLAERGVKHYDHRATQMRKSDYSEYDLLIGMDSRNIQNMLRIVGGDPDSKIRRLLDYTDDQRDILDPWYTGDFETTYCDVLEGCTALLNSI